MGRKQPSKQFTLQFEQFYRDVGGLIRSARKQRNMRQGYLAERVGLTRTSLTNIEKGRQKLLLHTLSGLAAVLGVSPIELLPKASNTTLAGTVKLPEDQKQREFVVAALGSITNHEPASQTTDSPKGERTTETLRSIKPSHRR